MQEEIIQNEILPLTLAEQEQATLAAFLGATDDLEEELASPPEDRRPDALIFGILQGMVSDAPEFVRPALLERFTAIGQAALLRGEDNCAHPHGADLNARVDQSESSEGGAHGHGESGRLHGHDEDHEEDDEDGSGHTDGVRGKGSRHFTFSYLLLRRLKASQAARRKRLSAPY